MNFKFKKKTHKTTIIKNLANKMFHIIYDT